MNRLLFLYIVASSLICHGMKKSVQRPQVTLYNTYNGQVINTQSIDMCIPIISSDLENKLSDKQKKLLTTLVKQKQLHKNPIECFIFLQQKLRREGQKYIKSYSNFIVEPVEGWLCKISGPPNRVRLICECKKINFEKKSWKFKQLKELPKTYQTMSRMFHWLRVKEAIKKYKLSNLMVPDMYVMKLNYLQGCEDTNTVVWQKKVKKATLFSKLGKKRQESILLTKQNNNKTMLEQLLIVGKYAGLLFTHIFAQKGR